MPEQEEDSIEEVTTSLRDILKLTPDEEKKREAEKKCYQFDYYQPPIERDKSGTEQNPDSFEEFPDLNLTDLSSPHYQPCFGYNRRYQGKIKPPDQTTEELLEPVAEEEKVPPPSTYITGHGDIVEPS